MLKNKSLWETPFYLQRDSNEREKKQTYYNQWKIVTPSLLKIPFIVSAHCQTHNPISYSNLS